LQEQLIQNFIELLNFLKSMKKYYKQLFIIIFIIIIFDFEKESHYFKYLIKNKLKLLYNKNLNAKIFIMTHKDFENVRYNPSYTIVVDDKSILKNSYNLDIIDSKEGELFNKSRAYGELSKLYYIFKIYKNETISSKYIGLNHYRRYFNFKDNIPHLDYIFRKYDVILNDEYDFNKGIREQYCENHICKNFDELIQIIKDIKPDYYETALHTINETKIYSCNLFIMKKKDFFEYCEFMFDILFEFDKRNNFTSDNDVLNYAKKIFHKPSSYYYQSRIQGFLAERLSNIFFRKYFKRIKTYGIEIIKERDLSLKVIFEQQQSIKKNQANILFILKLIFFLLLIISYLFLNWSYENNIFRFD